MILEKGKNYKAEAVLSGLHAFAPNIIIEAKLKEFGFKDVKVFGSGPLRSATGTYDGETKDIELPKEIKKMIEV